MASPFKSTTNTPIFPPPLLKKHLHKSSCDDDDNDDPASTSDPQKETESVPYIQKLKQRYLQLASIPYELCAPSPQENNTPEAKSRIESIKKKMRERRECRLPFELALTCVRLTGGEWDGEPLSDIEDDHYILPRSEEEWFQWERRRKAVREKRKAERQAQQRRDDIAKWTEGVQVDNTSVQDMSLAYPQSLGLPSDSLFAGISPPAAPMLEPLHDFNDSISGNSAPSLPFSISAFIDIPGLLAPPTVPIPLPPPPPIPSIPSIPPFLPPIPSSLSATRPIVQPKGSTSLRDHQLTGTNPQLSSPVSPPRSLKPLANMTQGSFPVSSKRLKNHHEYDESPYNGLDILDTPRPHKRYKPADEPITPKSVERRTLSQSSQIIENVKPLPSLSELLASAKAASKKGSSGRKSIRSSQTPCRDMLALRDMTCSQIPFSMFIPQAESTQARAQSLDPDAVIDAS